MPASNLTQILRDSAERFPDCTAQRYWDGRQWIDRSYSALWTVVQEVARGLSSLGVRPEDRVGILAKTRPEWVVADMAILCCDAISVPIYPSVPADQVRHIVEDANIRVLIAENDALAKKVPDSVTIVQMESDQSGRPLLYGLAAPGQPLSPARTRDALATLIYTSGTTGLPKGVMLTHGNILSNLEDIGAAMAADPETRVGVEDVVLSFLPLSHVLERTTHYFFLASGSAIAYARSTDQLPEDLLTLKPTLMVSVPRVFEKIYSRVQTQVDSYPFFTRSVFRAGVKAGVERYRRLEAGLPVAPAMVRRQHLYDRLVYRKIRHAVGGRLRFAISGGAPLAPEIGIFFYSMGIPILEGYGLTETAPVLAVNRAPIPHYGTVGPLLPRVEVRIAEDGEILARGPNIALGYWNLPEETQEAFEDGWFHTGDVGRMTPEGYLQVTDRKKYLLVLSTGKNVAPQAVEQKLTLSPWIEQAVVLGNRQKYVSALLYLNPEQTARWARQLGRAVPDLADSELAHAVQAEVDRVTAELAPFERPKRVGLLPAPLTEETGELTPSLKVKLPAVEAKYGKLIASLYEEGSERKSRGHQRV